MICQLGGSQEPAPYPHSPPPLISSSSPEFFTATFFAFRKAYESRPVTLIIAAQAHAKGKNGEKQDNERLLHNQDSNPALEPSRIFQNRTNDSRLIRRVEKIEDNRFSQKENGFVTVIRGSERALQGPARSPKKGARERGGDKARRMPSGDQVDAWSFYQQFAVDCALVACMVQGVSLKINTT